MFKPEFPYKKNQLILSSDRVTLHSKTDAIFLFGKQAVALSSVKTINLDANEKVLVYSPIIELGNKAQQDGGPAVLGNRLNQQLSDLVNGIQSAAILLNQVSETNIGASMEYIRNAAQILYNTAQDSKAIIDNKYILSEIVYVR